MSHDCEISTLVKQVNWGDISEHLSTSDGTVHSLIQDEKLPSYEVGKHYKFKISEVYAWVRSGEIDD